MTSNNNKSDSLVALAEMGFSTAASQEALDQQHGNLDAAVQSLLGGNNAPVQPEPPTVTPVATLVEDDPPAPAAAPVSLTATNVMPVPPAPVIVQEERSRAAATTAIHPWAQQRQQPQVPYQIQQPQTPEPQVRYMTFTRDSRNGCDWFMNLLWIVIGGWHLCTTWATAGLILCVTIIGFPCGMQVLKMAWFLLMPFGKSLVFLDERIEDEGMKCCCRSCNCLMNVLWAVTAGWILALQAFLTGVLLCLTIVGIPFGCQCFKLTMLSFMPFGIDFTAERSETVAVVSNEYQRMRR